MLFLSISVNPYFVSDLQSTDSIIKIGFGNIKSLKIALPGFIEWALMK